MHAGRQQHIDQIQNDIRNNDIHYNDIRDNHRGIANMRDYSLVGENSRLAVESGLATATWYHPDVPRKRMKELMARSDSPAIRDTAIWLGILVVTGVAGAVWWHSWLSIACFVVYGVMYGSASDSRWHECGHGTAFKTRWMNAVVYQIACFMLMRNPTVWRWSHARHHTDTIIVGRDPEVLFTRPPKLVSLSANLFALSEIQPLTFAIFRHAYGRLNDGEKSFIPEEEHRKAFVVARIWLAIYAVVVALCVATRSILPAMLVGLPKLYGAWHMVLCGMLQHGGLAEDVLDHRLNSRTVYLNRFSRFVYWNMNYHLEHHLFPMVPFHALPALHEELKTELPVPTAGFVAGFRELVPALLRQRTDPSYSIPRFLPDGTPIVAPEPVGISVNSSSTEGA
jgi:fatty acid desaturase